MLNADCERHYNFKYAPVGKLCVSVEIYVIRSTLGRSNPLTLLSVGAKLNYLYNFKCTKWNTLAKFHNFYCNM